MIYLYDNVLGGLFHRLVGPKRIDMWIDAETGPEHFGNIGTQVEHMFFEKAEDRRMVASRINEVYDYAVRPDLLFLDKPFFAFPQMNDMTAGLYERLFLHLKVSGLLHDPALS